MPLKVLQNFYKATITTAWAVGVGNRYVDILPTPTSGILVVNPSSTSKREIVQYSAKGTDAGGNYITLSVRGVGGTTNQAHSISESVRMNITAEHYADIQIENDLKINLSYLDNDEDLTANSSVKIPTQYAVKTYANTKVGQAGNVTIADVKTFLASPIVPTPTTGTQAVNKAYADALAIAGAPNASTTIKGIAEEATQSEIEAQTASGATGARLFMNPSTFLSAFRTLFSIESTTSATYSLTTTAGQKVLVIAKGQIRIGTMTLSYNGTVVDTTTVYGSNTIDLNAFTLLWTATPGAATADLVISGGLDLRMIIIKI